MTGFLVLLLIVAALVVGLEVHHRRLLRTGPYVVGTVDRDLLRMLHDLRALR